MGRQSKMRSRSRSRQGGGGLNYSDAQSYVGGLYGSDVKTQWDNTFDIKAGDMGSGGSSNVIKPIAGGGKRKRRRKSKKGGFLGGLAAVIEQAVAPGVLLGLQQTYRKKGSSGRGSRRRGSRRR